MASELADLYREVILDHAKHPRRAGLREPFTVQVHQVNPTCGDEVTLRLLLTRDGEGDVAEAVVTDVSYDSLGCSISVAATSVLAEAVTGKTLTVALARYDAFRDVVTVGAPPAAVTDDASQDTAEGDAAAFAGVARVPGRVTCALLGWTAFREAVVRAGS